MFGTLKPQGCGLDTAARQEHRRLYCGLCQTLGADHGQLSRVLVSFDAVFLAVLVEGLSAAPAAASQTRCPILPVVHRPTASPDSPAMRFAAAASILLADQWVADRAADTHRRGALLRWLQPWGSPSVQQAHDHLGALGVDLSALRAFAAHQQQVEVQGQTPPAQAAAPTARALRLVFGSIADLPGVLPHPGLRESLEGLGDATGRIIYHLDALEDLERDALSGAFNPGLDTHGHPDGARVALCRQALRDALAEARALIDTLPWQRDRALVEDILLNRQGKAARQAIQRAEALLEAAAQARLAEQRAWPAWRQLAWTLATALLTLGLWLQSAATAFAQQPTPPPPDASRQDTGTPPEREFLPLPEPPPPEPPPAEGCPNPCTELERSIHEFFAAIQSCFGCCTEGPGECNSFCSSCNNSMRDCGRGCNQGCDACSTCGQGCQNCGQGCQSCGQGCQGCNNCGQGCQGCNNCGQGCQGC